MRTTDEYVGLLTNEHRARERFSATVAASVDPLVALQELVAGLPAKFDLDTAAGSINPNTPGPLDILGQWIGRSRFVYVPIEGVFFRWDTNTLEGWDSGVWQGEFEAASVVSVLEDAAYRKLLLGKVAANHWRGDRAGQYEIVRTAFGANGSVLIIDNQNMTQTVLVNVGALTAVERAMLEGGYVPIKPAGVGVTFEDYSLEAFEFSPYWSGLSLAGELLYFGVAAERVVFGESDWLTATANVPFTNEAIFTVKLNGVEIGTATFPAGGVAPVSAAVALVASPTTMMPDDILSIHAPAIADGTGADVGMTLYGTRIPSL